MATLHASFRALTLSSTSTAFSSAAQVRNASILTNLRPIPGSTRNKKRLGRGPASGKGKTSGRGHKGQKQHGKVPAGFNGGQTSAEETHGKRGMQSQPFKMDLRTLNVDRLQFWIDQGRIDPTQMITLRELAKTRCVHGVGEGIKLLARNAETLHTPIHITVSRASAQAIAAVEKAGGTVQTRYYTKPSIKRIMQGETHPFLSKLSPSAATPQPTPPSSPITSLSEATATEYSNTEPEINAAVAPSADAPQSVTEAGALSSYPPPDAFKFRLPDAYSRKDLEYYRDPAHRGYLAYQVQEGRGPSLYFKSPQQLREEVSARRREKRRLQEGGGANTEEKIDTGRIW